MEGKNESFSDIFGAKEPSPSSSAGIFASMFPPPLPKTCKKLLGPEVSRNEHKQAWSGENARKKNSNSNSNSNLQEPCHLSSSLHYSESSGNQFKKEGGEGNNSQSASRGNWWQGSLYY